MMADADRDTPFLSERRALGLIGAALVATIAYGFVTIALYANPFDLTRWVIFFVVFALVFTGLSYLVWRSD